MVMRNRANDGVEWLAIPDWLDAICPTRAATVNRFGTSEKLEPYSQAISISHPHE